MKYLPGIMKKHDGNLRISRYAFGSLFVIFSLVFGPAQAATTIDHGIVTAFDWQATWGTFDFTGTSDPGIPDGNLSPKTATRGAISSYGTLTDPTSLGLIKTYTIDFNNDAATDAAYSSDLVKDVVLDGSAYFAVKADGSQASLGNTSSSLCDAKNGCYLTIYRRVAAPTYVVKADVTPTTVTAADGTVTTVVPTGTATSATDTTAYPCPTSASSVYSPNATYEACTTSVNYNLRPVFESKVLSWTFMKAATFTTFLNTTSGLGMKNSTIYNPPSASLPVLKVTLSTGCSNEEVVANGNSACVKYYQFNTSVAGGAGQFADLYNPIASAGVADNSTRFTHIPYGKIDAVTGVVTGYISAPGDVMAEGVIGSGIGYGHKLTKGTPVIEHMAGDTVNTAISGTANASYVAYKIVNTSSNDYFFPTSTLAAYDSFISNPPPGVTVTNAGLRFTAWLGLTCPAAAAATGTPHGERWYLQAGALCPTSGSSASYTAYNPAHATTIYPTAGNATLNGRWSFDGFGNYTINAPCTASTTITRERFCQSETSAFRPCSECVAAKAPYVDVYGNVQPYDGSGCSQTIACPSLVSYLGDGGHCLAGNTMLSLPNGKKVALAEVKVGDSVLGFIDPRGPVQSFKVKAVAVTENEPMVKINKSLTLTSNHVVLDAAGVAVVVSSLKVGDSLITQSGKATKIKTITPVDTGSKVYNIQLEGNATGFIADGVRVLSMEPEATRVEKK